jgi:hypothetical protein
MKKANLTPQIFASGRIIKAENFNTDEIYIKWEIVHGTHYKVINGQTKGETFQSVSHVM